MRQRDPSSSKVGCLGSRIRYEVLVRIPRGSSGASRGSFLYSGFEVFGRCEWLPNHHNEILLLEPMMLEIWQPCSVNKGPRPYR